MRLKQSIGLVLGLAGLVLFPLMGFPGLSFPGALTLGIFWMAAIFWMTEPIPIYATSMLIIFLQVLLLSNGGPIALYDPVPLATLSESAQTDTDGQTYFSNIPLQALAHDDSGNPVVYRIKDNQSFETVRLTSFEAIEGTDRINIRTNKAELSPTDRIAKDSRHWRTRYRPESYGIFYASLASPIIILFLGGFALAAAAVKFGLDRNMTRVLLRPFGQKPAYVCLGLMLVTAILSAFMSNTATTAMMMTVVLPIIAQLDKGDPFRKAIALSIPVGANIGGIATPIGSPPNAIALAALNEQGIRIAFSTWMVMAIPLVLIMIVVGWRVLLFLFPPAADRFQLELKGHFNRSKKAIATYVIFGLTVLLWVTEKLHGIPATIIAFLPLALLPAVGVLSKEDIRGFSWDVLWLVAGGISLGISMQNTGMADWLINQIAWEQFGGMGLILIFGLVGFTVANLVSHTVSATILIPLAVGLAVGGVGGETFDLTSAILVIAIVVSFSMLLPISTPPNAIAMSSNMIETKDMVRSGAIIGVAGYVGTVLFGLLLWPLLL